MYKSSYPSGYLAQIVIPFQFYIVFFSVVASPRKLFPLDEGFPKDDTSLMIGELNSKGADEKHSSEQVLHFPRFFLMNPSPTA